MAPIRTIDEADATGPLAEIYRRLADRDGRVASILEIQSLSPGTLEAACCNGREHWPTL